MSGIILLYTIQRVLLNTGSLNFVPSLILLGSFLIPVTFVTYLYEIFPVWEVPFTVMVTCFLWGGAIGTVVAGMLEFNVLKSLGFLPMLAVGLIEESVKLTLPLWFYFGGRYRSEAAGILIGTASAMGFAALETMGYSFVSLLQSRGDIAVLDTVLFVRGLLSPAGHAAWTGLVCAVLWRERVIRGKRVLNGKVIGAFVVAVVLHAAWDTFNGLRTVTFIEFAKVELLSAAIAIISLVLLIRRVREAHEMLNP